MRGIDSGRSSCGPAGVFRPFPRAFIVVLWLNGIFLCLAVWWAMLPREPLIDRVREAFAAEELLDRDYLPFDSRRGHHQYNDCLILQMITNSETSIWSSAIAPLVYVDQANTWMDQCATLRKFIDNPETRSLYRTHRYARYWHGYSPIVAALLLRFSLADVRKALKLAVYGALALMVIAASRTERGLFAAMVAIAGSATTVWGIPYFSQSLNGPGDTFVVLGLALFLLCRKSVSQLNTLVPFCAAYGASIAYLDVMTGLLPTGAAWMFATSYLVAVSSSDGDFAPCQAWTLAMAGLMAMTLGAVITVAVKIALSVATLGREPAEVFVSQLTHYTGRYVGPDGAAVIVAPFAALLREGSGLTHGSWSAAVLMYAGAVLAWLTAGCLALGSSRARRTSDFCAFVVAAAGMPLWILMFQNHTRVHSFLTIRLLIIPISLGLAALVWQISLNAKLNDRPRRSSR